METKSTVRPLVTAAFAAVVATALTGGCSGDGDFALMQTCSVADGRGNVYQSTNMEMLDALEDAMQQCETAAADPSTCVARGCRGAQ